VPAIFSTRKEEDIVEGRIGGMQVADSEQWPIASTEYDISRFAPASLIR
jgi:hypothetical protein